MSQAESDPSTFAAFATFLGTPLPENPIRALRILRKEAAAEIERLIAFLDALGGDPDLELTGDDEPDQSEEPSLGWTTNINQAARTEQRFGAQSWGIDLEQEHDGREPDDDLEPDADGEPSLGWTGMEASYGVYGLFPNGMDNDVDY